MLKDIILFLFMIPLSLLYDKLVMTFSEDLKIGGLQYATIVRY